MNEVWLIRHGETEWSRSGQHTGRTDIPLIADGRAQARMLGQFLAGRKFALVLSSPLQRALETARLAGYGDAVEIDPNLSEWDYGDYEGRTAIDIRKKVPDWSLWMHGVPNGETAGHIVARAEAVIRRVEPVQGDVALFAHGHILRVLALCWIEQPVEFGARLALATASVSRLGRERGVRALVQWNVSPGV
jgi:broad specificity phosphatase PhoE